MKIGSLKEVRLTSAKDTFLFDFRVAGLDAQVLTVYRNVMTSFISFTGDIRVQELTVDHIRFYIANLSDGPGEGEDHEWVVASHYAVIEAWMRWIDAQNFVTERIGELAEPPHLTDLFPLLIPTRKLAYCC